MAESAAGQAAAAVIAERDAIQANLLELDGGFTRRMLDGATLTGLTRERWAAASATLADLWETYLAYSAVVDRVAELGAGARRPAKKDLPELDSLLTGASVRMAGIPVPLAHRNLLDTGVHAVTLAAAVAAMRRSFSDVAKVTSAVEAVWAQVGERLDAAAAELADGRLRAAGLGEELEAAVRDAQASLQATREAVNADPLGLWSGGRVDTSAADLVRQQVAGLTARIAELDRVRSEAQRRIDGLSAGVAAARAARADALAAWHRAAQRIAALPPLPPDIAEPPLAGLAALAAAGRWTALAAELDRCDGALAASIKQTGDCERSALTSLASRDELRGLLGAYKAKAARLGVAEDADLVASYDQARDLLWTAPCNLTTAADAVAGYQLAIQRTTKEGGRR
ncbi:MAG: hypothetical protein ABSA02_19810 [Trebonia sp.]|jgi:hypothetical protein